jgi:membrane associated rhomboid family serine protease
LALYENPNYLDEPTVFPYFIVIATFSQIAMYILWVYVGDGNYSFQDKAFDQIGGPSFTWLESVSPFSSCSNLHYQLWRYVTYIWIHANVWHLVSNCVMQFFVGASLESVHGWWRVGGLYILGGIAGGLNVTMFTPDVTVVGASGAIYALLGMILANIWLNWEVSRKNENWEPPRFTVATVWGSF